MSETIARRLERAPVIYVLCQVRFPVLLKMDKHVPDIQEALRKDFPRFARESVRSLELSGVPDGDPVVSQSVEDRWTFMNKNRDAGFILRGGDLVFHTSAYTRFSDFSDQLAIGLRALGSIDIGLVERIGLRYVDYLTPMNGKEVRDYMKPSMLGFSFGSMGLDEKNAIHNQENIAITQDGTHLIVKFSEGVHKRLLPNDLQPLGLEKPREPILDKRTGILDFDHYWAGEDAFDVAGILKRLDGLHALTGEAFRASFSEEVTEIWSD